MSTPPVPPARGRAASPLGTVLTVLAVITAGLVMGLGVQRAFDTIPEDPATAAFKVQSAALKDFRGEQERQLQGFNWVDPSKQIADVPVSAAIEYLAKTNQGAPKSEAPPSADWPASEPETREPKDREGLDKVPAELLGAVKEFLVQQFGAGPASLKLPPLDEPLLAPIREELQGNFKAEEKDKLEAAVAAEAKKRGIEPIAAFLPEASLKEGASIYARYCQNCHGAAGAGNGPAAKNYLPSPRNFTWGSFKFTSTPYAAKPTKDDLYLSIAYGFHDPYKKVIMPAFRNILSQSQIEAVRDYTIFLSLRGQSNKALLDQAAADPEAKTFDDLGINPGQIASGLYKEWLDAHAAATQLGPRPMPNAKSIARGRALYLDGQRLQCLGCHGNDAKGNGPSFIDRPIYDKVVAEGKTLEAAIAEFYGEEKAEGKAVGDLDAFEKAKTELWNTGSLDGWGYPLRPANLHWGRFKNSHAEGSSAEDQEKIARGIYLRIANGINNAKMPQHSNVLQPNEIWDLANFVTALPYQPDLLSAPAPKGPSAARISWATVTAFFGVAAIVALVFALIRDLGERVRGTANSIFDEEEPVPARS